jgi:hypothetical protein
MAVDERARHELHTKLEEVLGPENAARMMALTPPAGWGEVATKRDLDHLDGSLRSALDQHRAATDAAIAQLRAAADTAIAQLRAEFKDDLRQQTRTIMMSMVLMVIATAGLAFSAATLA